MNPAIPGIGGGAYEAECTVARQSAKARGAILLIMDGDRGNGFSVQIPPETVVSIPLALRQMADQIEAAANAIAQSGGRG